jgi:hypothetical protein
VTSIGQIADAAGWPSDQLVVLDRRPVGLLFVDESGEQIVVRHARTHELRELALDEDGRPWDVAAARARNRRRADGYRRTVSPELIEILVRHAELDSIPVTVTSASRAGSGPATPGDHTRVERQLSGREILAVADDPATVRIELAGEPVVND